MIDSLITSKTRIKLILKFFLNSNTKSYLRNLEQEFGESSNAIRVELNKMEKAGLLNTEKSGNKKYYQANTSHPLYIDINNIVKKNIGIDQIVEKITTKIGELKRAYITGDYAQGIDSKIIDLVLIGKNIDSNYVNKLIIIVEKIIKKKIRCLILTSEQMKDYFTEKPVLLIWKADIQ